MALDSTGQLSQRNVSLLSEVTSDGEEGLFAGLKEDEDELGENENISDDPWIK